MLLALGSRFDNNPVIKQRNLKDDKNKEEFSLNESIYVINLPSKKDYKQQRRYTCELKHKELLN